MKISNIAQLPLQHTVIYLLKDISFIANTSLTQREQEYVAGRFVDAKTSHFTFNRLTHQIYVHICPEADCNNQPEKLRRSGDKAVSHFKKEKITTAVVAPLGLETDAILAFCEGFALGAYQFLQYKNKNNDWVWEELFIFSELINELQAARLENLIRACYKVRDLVNQPANALSAESFARIVAEDCQAAGIEATVMDRETIASEGMTGLLTVNKGSKSAPTFTVLNWKPADAVNRHPIVLVGKGLVFDTGGINLKPMSGLDTMKSDMAGGAAVFGALYALALNSVPVHVVGLIPATDNRPGEDAMVPGDIITMGNGKTVEIVNTDAEGRLILADALLYASRLDPRLVIDIATLTGAVVVALGRFGIGGMHHKAKNQMKSLMESGMRVNERIVEFPFWEDYDKDIESDVADIRNLGKNRGGGVITAGKFLSHFTDYPWIHLDIAAMAFMESRESYLGKGGTAVGVRLLYDFIERESRANS